MLDSPAKSSFPFISSLISLFSIMVGLLVRPESRMNDGDFSLDFRLSDLESEIPFFRRVEEAIEFLCCYSYRWTGVNNPDLSV